MPRSVVYWLASLLFAGLVLAKFSPQTGLTSLIRFGRTWEDRRHSSLQSLPVATVAESNGYDGQFYAQFALDPLLRDAESARALDAPAYRARRILTPAVAALVGCGNAWWTLQAYALSMFLLVHPRLAVAPAHRGHRLAGLCPLGRMHVQCGHA